MRTLPIILTAAALATTIAINVHTNAAKAAPSAAPAPIIYAIEYTPGTAWKAGKSVYEQDLNDHIQYEIKLFKAKKLLLGGPFGDNTGGLAVISASGDAEAKKIVNEDPAKTEHIMVPHLHRWEPKFNQFDGPKM